MLLPLPLGAWLPPGGLLLRLKGVQLQVLYVQAWQLPAWTPLGKAPLLLLLLLALLHPASPQGSSNSKV